MGTTFLSHIKNQACCFLQEKYKTARLAFTDVTPAEMLAEEATSNGCFGPDAKTMTRIVEASFRVDDFWRIVDVLHKRLYLIEWKQWRQSYKTLVLLEFMLTHGPYEFAQEFLCDIDVIKQLGTFQHIDDKGFDWGMKMQMKSDWILELLGQGKALKDARVKAQNITKEIRGFGNSTSSTYVSSSYSSDPSSPTNCSTPTSSNSEAAIMSSFGSLSYFSTSTLSDFTDANNINFQGKGAYSSLTMNHNDVHDYEEHHSSFFCTPTTTGQLSGTKGKQSWDGHPIKEEEGSLLDLTQPDLEEKDGFFRVTQSKFDCINNLSGYNEKMMLCTKYSHVDKLQKTK